MSLNNYTEETAPLFKLLRTEAFRFIIVCFNHYSFVEQLQKEITQRFPNRAAIKLDAKTAIYQDFSSQYFDLKSGFFFIENFDDILKEERNSLGIETPEYAAANERRRNFTTGLNLRRDKFAKFPIAIFVFVYSTANELHAKTIMEKMPDLWSFRSWMLDLQKERDAASLGEKQKGIGANTGEQELILEKNIIENPKQEAEFKRLLSLLEKTPAEEVAYRLTLYPQIVEAGIEAHEYELTLRILEEWENIADEKDKGFIWTKRGDLLTIIGNLNEALNYFEKALIFFKKNEDKANVAIIYSKLGDTQKNLGNLKIALQYFKEDTKLTKELGKTHPRDITFKNGLAIAYIKLGQTQIEIGNLNIAVQYFENGAKLFKELFEAYPQNISFKNGLAVSYSRIGLTQKELGDLNTALLYFKKYNTISKELYKAYPLNVNLKNSLAISYEKLGDIQKKLGDLKSALKCFQEFNILTKELCQVHSQNIGFKTSLAISYGRLGDIQKSLGKLEIALQHFEKYNKLSKKLYKTQPNNINSKNILAISYEKLGETQKELGNLEIALEYFKKDEKLTKKIFEAYPQNVNLKNGLAISYCKLAQLHEALNDTPQAKSYFEQAAVIFAQLANDFPTYAEFQRNYKNVQKDLEKF